MSSKIAKVIPNSNPDFWVNPDPDVCHIATKKIVDLFSSPSLIWPSIVKIGWWLWEMLTNFLNPLVKEIEILQYISGMKLATKCPICQRCSDRWWQCIPGPVQWPPERHGHLEWMVVLTAWIVDGLLCCTLQYTTTTANNNNSDMFSAV